jgi:sugar phosphate isomerase/epimerase
MLALPLDIRVAYEALSWGRHVNLLTQAWEIVQDADRSNLGLCVDSYHAIANGGEIKAAADIDPRKVFLVQLSDFLWQETRSPQDRMETARHYRVFPGEGVHSEQVLELVRILDDGGYRGDYSFEVFNDDYRQIPVATVAERARNSVKWIAGQIGRRTLPQRRGPAQAA